MQVKDLDFLDPCEGARVWVLAPHPNDEVFGCGGTLSLLAASGAVISVDIITDGGFSDFLIDRCRHRLRELKPRLILIPSPWEVHPDHLAADARRWPAPVSTWPSIFLKTGTGGSN